MDSPYVVTSVAEEYAVLGMNDYERGMQSLSLFRYLAPEGVPRPPVSRQALVQLLMVFDASSQDTELRRKYDSFAMWQANAAW